MIGYLILWTYAHFNEWADDKWELYPELGQNERDWNKEVYFDECKFNTRIRELNNDESADGVMMQLYTIDCTKITSR